jgi:CoA-transferase family III
MTADDPAAAPLAAAWIASGAAALAGRPDGPGLVPPAAVLRRIDRLGTAARADPWAVLTERAAVAGLRRQGAVSCGGGTRLVRAADGWLAASLVRPEDVDAVAAWLEIDRDPGPDPWPTVVDEVARRPVGPLVAQAALLGLPVAAVGERGGGDLGGRDAEAAVAELPGTWVDLGPARRPPRPVPLVVDLSSLWAGPVCARLLGSSGADVIKVESTARPDGARRGPPLFFDRLHAGQRAMALDLSSGEGRDALGDLLGAADVVIEGSRPRALAQLELGAGDLGAGGPGLWLSITGHGRSGPGAERVAFGDDAAAAGGLVAWTATGPVFAGDALADPLTGLAAAAAARSPRVGDGRRWLVDLALAGVAGWVAGGDLHPDGPPWTELPDPPPPAPVPPPPAPAPALGADTEAVLSALRHP